MTKINPITNDYCINCRQGTILGGEKVYCIKLGKWKGRYNSCPYFEPGTSNIVSNLFTFLWKIFLEIIGFRMFDEKMQNPPPKENRTKIAYRENDWKNNKGIAIGAITGWIVVFILITVNQVSALGQYWGMEFFVISIPGSAILGFIPGALGGWIVSKKWRSVKGALLGGFIGGLCMTPFTVIFQSCVLLGGC